LFLISRKEIIVLHALQGGLSIRFTDKCVVVEERYALIPGWPKQERREIAVICSEAEWYASAYCHMANDYLADMVMWFWIDMDHSSVEITTCPREQARAFLLPHTFDRTLKTW
jgi:hypothetical protein